MPAIALTPTSCTPSDSRVVFHVDPSPPNTYGALVSVERRRPSIQNSTRSRGVPAGTARQLTRPDTVAASAMVCETIVGAGSDAVFATVTLTVTCAVALPE